MGMSLAEGGHLTHGMPLNMSGKWFKVGELRPGRQRSRSTTTQMERLAREHTPKLIIAGASAYSAAHRLRALRQGARRTSARVFMVDMAHYAGLIAAGVYPTRCRTPTSSPPPRTRACAGRAAASS
jgi:glycine hydroxymethyltransferase